MVKEVYVWQINTCVWESGTTGRFPRFHVFADAHGIFWHGAAGHKTRRSQTVEKCQMGSRTITLRAIALLLLLVSVVQTSEVTRRLRVTRIPELVMNLFIKKLFCFCIGFGDFTDSVTEKYCA